MRSTSGSVDAPYELTLEQIVLRLGVDRDRGLTSVEAQSRFRQFGANQLSEAPGEPLWKKFAAQFQSLVIWILLIAATLSGVLGEWTDTVAILAIVLMNAILGFVQEERAERALAALRRLSTPQAKVVRDGALTTVAAADRLQCVHALAGFLFTELPELHPHDAGAGTIFERLFVDGDGVVVDPAGRRGQLAFVRELVERRAAHDRPMDVGAHPGLGPGHRHRNRQDRPGPFEARGSKQVSRDMNRNKFRSTKLETCFEQRRRRSAVHSVSLE